jgi:hypothetical protein
VAVETLGLVLLLLELSILEVAVVQFGNSVLSLPPQVVQV